MRDWKDDEVELVNAEGVVMSLGDMLEHHDDNQRAKLVGFAPPHKPESQGKIHVRWEGALEEDTCTYYPSVFNLKYRKVEKKDGVKLSFICIGRHAWGRGPTQKEALAKWRAAGGSGKCENIAVVAFTGDTFPYVDELGTFYTEKGAKIGWIRKEGKQA